MKQGRSHWHSWMVVFDLTLLALTVLLVVLIAGNVHGLPRVLATVGFACLVPGGALATRLPFREPDEILAMTVVLSLTILAAATLLMAWIGAWHPLRLTAGLSAAAAVVLLLDLFGHLASIRADESRWPVS